MSAKPFIHLLRNIFFTGAIPIYAMASESWEIAPAEKQIEPSTFHLKGQFERIEKLSEFSATMEVEHASLLGGREVVHSATRGLLIKGAMLADGVLFKNNGHMYLHPRSSRLPALFVENEHRRAALYSSYPGNTFFANWLMDDCVTYPMACEYGVPVRSALPKKSAQMAQYADLLGMQPLYSQNTYFDELVVFEDVGQNRHKLARAVGLSQKLLAGKAPQRHPGVYIVRGSSGRKRTLTNEMQLAEHLNAKYGLRIVDPGKLSAAQIVELCAGSELVVGVEGSHLIHGAQLLDRGGSLLVLQPPRRYCTMFKDLTTRGGQKYGIVVGKSESAADDFSVVRDEVDATIDLMLSAA